MNKNIIRILSLAALLAAFACEPKENIPSMEDYDLISVSSGADLAFKAIGGDGVITISPIDEKLEAVSQQSWCHITSVEGNKISVHVDEYGGLESRYAKIVLKAGEAEAVTVVQQYGIIVRTFDPKDITIKNNAQDVTIPYEANETLVNAVCDADWATIIVEPEILRIKVAENTSKEYRETTVNWNFGEMKGSFSLVQFDIAEAGLLGDWLFSGMGGNNFTTKYELNGTLSESADGNGYSLRLVYQTTMDVTFENVVLNKTQLVLPLGGCIGKRGSYFVFPIIAPGAGVTSYAKATTEGYLPMELKKDEEGVWYGTADMSAFGDGVFRFEMWTSDTHEGNSRSRMALKDLRMDKQ